MHFTPKTYIYSIIRHQLTKALNPFRSSLN
nr:MAG TPA: hypothetical protein [Caudoviricetes sp.]